MAKARAGGGAGGAGGVSGGGAARGRPRRGRRVVRVLGVVVVLLIVLVAVGPMIAGPIARPRVERAASEAIAGRVEVGRVSLSWFGSQRVERVRLLDPDGGEVALVDARVERGLLGLATNWRDVGRVVVAGRATVVRHADGTTNVERATAATKPAPPSPPGAEPVALPAGLRAALVVDGVTVTVVDESLPGRTGGTIAAVSIADLRGSASVEVGRPWTLELAARTQTGASAAALTDGGSLKVTARIDGLTDAGGKVDVAGATGSLAWEATLPGVETGGEIALEGGVARTVRPVTLSADVGALGAMFPVLAAAFEADESVSFTRLPTVRVEAEVGALPVPAGGGALDLRGASASLLLATGAVEGTALLPASPRRAFAVEPMEVRVDATDPASGVRVGGGTKATIGGEPAGDLRIALFASGLLDGSGAPRAGLPSRLEGSIDLTGFATPILQPFAEMVEASLPGGASIDLGTDLGPTVDVSVRAEAAPGSEASASAGAVTAAVRSANVEVDAALGYDGETVSTRGDGVRVLVRSAAPVLDRLLSGHGVSVADGARVEVRVPTASARVESLLASGGPDLRGVSAMLEVDAGETRATWQPAPSEPPRRVEIAPLALRVGAANADAPTVDLRASATVDGQSAGVVEVAVRGGGLLDGSGRPGLPRTVDGRVSVTDLSSSLVQSFLADALAAAGLNLPDDLGPTVSVLAVASTAVDGSGAATADVDLTVRSRHADVTAPLRWANNELSNREESVVVAMRRPGPILRRTVPAETRVRFGTTGWARAVVSDLRVPFDPASMTPAVHRARAEATITAGELAATYDPLPPGVTPRVQPVPLALSEFRAVAKLEPGVAPRVEADATLTHRERGFTAQARATLGGLIRDPGAGGSVMDSIDAAGVRPAGTIALVGVPVGLVEVLPPGLRRVGDRQADVLTIAREALGETIDVRAEVKGVGDATGVDVRVTYAEGSATLAGRYGASSVALERAVVAAKIRPRAAELLVEAFAPDPASLPRLSNVADVNLSVGGLTVALAPDGSPDWERTQGKASVEVRGLVPMRGVSVPMGEGSPPLRVDHLRLDNMRITLDLPAGALGTRGGVAEANVALRGFLTAEGVLFTLAGKGTAPVKDRALAGPASASFTLDQVKSAWVDKVLDRPGLVSGALGPTARIEGSATLRSLAGAPSTGGAAQPDVLTLGVASERVNTAGPISIALHADRMELTAPAEVRAVVHPEWGNRWVFAPSPDGRAHSLAFAAPSAATVRIERLAVPLGEGVGPLRAPTFVVQASASLPDTSLVTDEGVALKVGGVAVDVRRGSNPRELAFTIDVPRWTLGDRPEVRPTKSRIAGTIARFADDAGNPSFATAVVNVEAGIEPIPTELLDGLANQGGLLVDALGERVNFSASAQNLSMSAGTLRATAVSPNANATVQGRMANGVFVVDQSSSATVSRVTTDLTDRFRAAIPIVARFEKNERDEALRVTMDSPVVVPIDGTFDALNGDLTLDLGTASFATSDMFSKVLRVVQQRDAGQVGKRMPAIKFHMRDGVVTFDRYPLPLGEFTVHTEGVINLSSRRVKIRSGSDRDAKNFLEPGHMEVLTVVPAGAVALETLDVLSTGILNLPGRVLPGLNTLTNVPFRTRGPIADPKTDVAVDLIGSQLINNIGRPDKLFENIGSGLR
ncbi:MAG: hypothetical protein KJZ54_01755 [Phycisphaerales bacterium]|nr:hypothetical protein [Phycisphaerales bacterium]